MVSVFDKGIVKLRFSKYPAQTPPQHPQKQPRVHFADAHVVSEGVEVGHAVGGVLHGRFNPNRLDAAPVQADEDFRVEIHAVAYGFFADDRKRGGERVQAEAAHAVFDVARPSVQHVPEVGNFAPLQLKPNEINI